MGTKDPVDPDRTNAFTQEYAEAVKRVAAKHNLPVFDLHSALQLEEDWQTRLLIDGLHFSPAGQAKVGWLLVELLQQAYPEFRCAAH